MENDVVHSAVVQRVRAAATRVVGRFDAALRTVTRPAPLVVGLLRDLTRSNDELIAENALLRQQLVVPSTRARMVR